MIERHRLRRWVKFGLTAVLAMAIVACVATGKYPNTTFEPKTDLGRAIDFLWDRLLLLGTIVFVLTEVGLLFIVWKYRHRPGQPDPRQIHGNTKLELLWTLIPAVVLVFIAVPTVRVIFQTQGKPPADALVIDVYGHQWWWEFRYPQYGLTVANELYLPAGRAVHFKLQSKDVLHSFWVPQLGAKRDLISNHTNHIVLKSDANIPSAVWNGFCTEYCGVSHSNMRFRVYTVAPQEFEQWITWQKSPAAFSTAPTPASASAGGTAAAAAAPSGFPAAMYVFPRERLRAFNIPTRPIPAGVSFPSNLRGDSARGEKTYSSAACIGCHMIRGNPMSLGQIGPDLTHLASRYTIAAGTYPNDGAHLARWIKNSRVMKPGSLMPTLGKGQYDPKMKMTVTAGGLDDRQIADIVAYLQALK